MSRCPLVQLGRKEHTQCWGCSTRKACWRSSASWNRKAGATTDSEIALSSVEAGPSRPRANGRNRAAATAAVKSAGKARPHGIAKQSATTKLELAKTSGEAGSPWSRAGGTTGTAEGAADAKSVAKAQPHEIAKLGVYFRAWTGVNARLWKARVRSGSGVMLPRPLCSQLSLCVQF